MEQRVQHLEWTTSGSQVLVNGHPVFLKGLSHFGFETDSHVVHGIWQGSNKNLDFFLDFIESNNFNAIRLPVSMELIRNNPGDINVQGDVNPELNGKRALEILDIYISKAAERGLLVMLDNHHMTATSGTTELWYNDEYSEADVISLWQQLITRYRDKWNVFAVDLKNEPHDSATWGDSSPSTDWNKAAERMITALSDFKGLFFVQGVEWGGRMELAAQYPICTGNISLDNRIIYSAHCHGPPIIFDSEFSDSSYFEKLDAIFMVKYGFIHSALRKPLIVGEWDGRIEEGTSDYTWMSWYAKWIRCKCNGNNFYWCLNPNSGDSGGLLDDDWTTPIARKLHLATEAQPNPTKFRYSNGHIYITHGSSPGAEGNTPSYDISARPTATGCGVTIGVKTVASWMEKDQRAGEYALIVTNNSSSEICGVTIGLSVVPKDMWNLIEADQGNFGFYKRLKIGETTEQPGFIALGKVDACIVSVESC